MLAAASERRAIPAELEFAREELKNFDEEAYDLATVLLGGSPQESEWSPPYDTAGRLYYHLLTGSDDLAFLKGFHGLLARSRSFFMTFIQPNAPHEAGQAAGEVGLKLAAEPSEGTLLGKLDPSASIRGSYEGAPPKVALRADGRTIELLAEFSFIDAKGTEWRVPPGAHADGASIPRAAWTIIGSPLTGKYRDASIVHDWFCDIRTRTPHETHYVFYEAMRVSGVSLAQAKIMYFAVRCFGPNWTGQARLNEILLAQLGPSRYLFAAPEIGVDNRPPLIASYGAGFSERQQAAILRNFAAVINNFTLEQINVLAEHLVAE